MNFKWCLEVSTSTEQKPRGEKGGMCIRSLCIFIGVYKVDIYGVTLLLAFWSSSDPTGFVS